MDDSDRRPLDAAEVGDLDRLLRRRAGLWGADAERAQALVLRRWLARPRVRVVFWRPRCWQTMTVHWAVTARDALAWIAADRRRRREACRRSAFGAPTPCEACSLRRQYYVDRAGWPVMPYEEARLKRRGELSGPSAAHCHGNRRLRSERV